MERNAIPRVVLVHDWLTGMRGGEKCLEVLCREWPSASLYTLLHRRNSVSPTIEALKPRQSLLGWLPGVHRYYRHLLPLMPWAMSGLRLPESDLVVSFSHCVAKGVRVAPGTPHVCYCFTPMRYIWHMRKAYFEGRVQGIKARVLDAIVRRLQNWDRCTAQGVTHFVAISHTVRQRIAECYHRDSAVIYPPVDTDFYTPAAGPREDHYLIVSAFAPYKRLDLAIAACGKLGRKLVIIGTGQDEARLRSLAGPEVRFMGWQSDEIIRQQLRRCRALLFPGEEDFGIVPVEAMACGAPVIAYGRGGATETVIGPQTGQPPTGVFFEEQSIESLADAIDRFEKLPRLNPADARRQALRFGAERFRRELLAYLDDARRGQRPAPLAA